MRLKNKLFFFSFLKVALSYYLSCFKGHWQARICFWWLMEFMFVRSFLLAFFMLFSTTFLFGQTGSPEVVAKAGDGIYTLLKQNGLDPALYFKSFLELNKEKIGKDSSLYIGKAYQLPLPVVEEEKKEAVWLPADLPKSPDETPGLLDIPLFGKAYRQLEIKDQQLKGAVYYLIAGHGGPDPGAVGKYGPYALCEDEYAYDVSLRLARRLMEHGATVYMIVQDANDGIREGNILEADVDEVCYPDEAIPYSQKERLRQRTRAVNKLYLKHKGAYQRMLAIHVDSRSKGQNIDVFFYHHENSPSGLKLAEQIHQTINSKYNRHQPGRDYFGSVSARSSLYVVKYSHPPAVFIELGNIKNERDQRRFVLPDNRQALANWICEGVLKDFSAP